VYNLEIKKVNYSTITYQPIKKIDNSQFHEDLKAVIETIPNVMHVGETVSCYNNKLLSLLDKHAPQKTIKIKNVPSSPWFDQEYSSLRRERRKAERKFWRSKNDIDKKAYLFLQKKCTEMVK